MRFLRPVGRTTPDLAGLPGRIQSSPDGKSGSTFCKTHSDAFRASSNMGSFLHKAFKISKNSSGEKKSDHKKKKYVSFLVLFTAVDYLLPLLFARLQRRKRRNWKFFPNLIRTCLICGLIMTRCTLKSSAPRRSKRI